MKRFLFIACFYILWFRCEAQETKPFMVNGEFQNTSLKEFFNRIEAQTTCLFYYDPLQVDSIFITMIFKDEPLQQALAKALKNIDLQFAVDKMNRIFITKGLKLVTVLPADFFPQTNQSSAVVSKDTVVDYGLQQQKTGKVTSVNKLYEIGPRTNALKGDAIIAGTIRNAKTGEALVNASVFINNTYATTTDAYGSYSLTIPAGKHTLNILAIGMKDTHLQLMVYGDGKMDADIPEQVVTLKEVVISARKTSNVMQVQLGVERLTIESIRRVPSLFGETDVLRIITTLPGVKTVGEASTGFNVRGGSADQNLILFNDANIYNPSHFFGMFSAFNPELIKDIELYKSSIPARFGGRLSSVLDVTSREGNKKKITGSAGVGVVTSRLHLEGPLGNEKTSFIFGGRTTYANWLLNLLPDEYKNSRASFQDVNIGINHHIDSSSQLYLNGYFSNDRFSLNSDTVYGYSNRNINIKWKKSFNNKLNAVFIAGADEYGYKVYSENNKVNAFTLQFKIQQLYAKTNFVYYKNQRHSFDFGASTLLYKLNPGSFDPRGNNSAIRPDKVDAEQALESGIYITHRFNPSNKLSVNTGLRYSLYNYLGPQQINYYAPGLPVSAVNLVETKTYSQGKIIKTYGGPEIRFSIRYAFTNSFSIKAGYNSQRQYIHMLSNTTAIAPTDIWKLSDPNIKPQQGDQVSLGFYKNLKSNTIETSVEIYYKRIRDYLDYKPGATLVMNHNIETEVINTKGKAYGAELLIKKPGGKLNGWISYTYSRILLKSSDTDPSVPVNNGKYYPANYDKPHDVTVMGTFRVNHRFSLSLNSTYSTGRPITLPIGRYSYAGSVRVLYSDRNVYRIPDYIRTDFSMNIEGNHKEHQKTHNSWTIGLYNMLGRKNPYSVYFISENGFVNGYKLSIFGSIIPFVNFNIRF
ncbi:MAG TPA: carboxypeptidase-like regulatory domain-containing protein [Chitinophagaceae bacterium]